MSWFSGFLDNGGAIVTITEVRFTQGAARLYSVGCSMSSRTQQFVSKTAEVHPADPVSHRSKVRWPDTELRLQGNNLMSEPIKITLTNRRKRFRTVIGTTVFTLASLNVPSAGKKPFKRTLLLETALSPSLNLKIDLYIQLQGVDSWSKIKPCIEEPSKQNQQYPKGSVVANPAKEKANSEDCDSTYDSELQRVISFASKSSHNTGFEGASALDAVEALAGEDISDMEITSGSTGSVSGASDAHASQVLTNAETMSLGTPSVRSRSSSLNKPSGEHHENMVHSLGSAAHDKDNALGFNLHSDTVGVVFIEIVSVANLPKFRTLTGISFDMDPFVVMSFGRKVYKTPYRRHTLNPTFNCKVAFEVMPNERQFSIVFAVWDMDRITLNDKVAETEIPVSEIMQNQAPVCDSNTHLYDLDNHVPSVKVLPLEHVAGTAEMVIKAHYYPEAAIRQQMWRGVIGLYLEEPQCPSHHHTNSTGEDLLEPCGNVAHLTSKPSVVSTSSASTNSRISTIKGAIAGKIKIKSIVRSREPNSEKEVENDTNEDNTDSLTTTSEPGIVIESKSANATSPSEGLKYYQLKALLNSLGSTLSEETIKQYFFYKYGLDPETDIVGEDLIVLELEDIAKRTSSRERIILFRICPICHQSSEKLHASRALHHLALCASRQWAESNSVLLDSNYVSSAQASKRWYANFLSKFSYGSYKLGAHSANILVQDRTSGQISEEKIATSVRIGIRMIYALGPVERKKFQNLLRRYTLKQGIKYSSRESASQIEPFIKYHNLDMSEVLLPVSSFATFNDFFYRKLKPGSRPCENLHESRTAVSAADCRLTIFPSITSATELWIKGKNFSIKRLLADTYPEDAFRYMELGSAIAIFRLAPQDYHRVHSPVDGIMGKPKHIEGHYYTVNPMAVRSGLDVFGENARTVFPIQSPVFGKVMVVMVGAMMVGSCIVTAEPGSLVRRTDELGYFRFGGSTVVVLFERQKLIPDSDLLANSQLKIETLVKVGSSVGHAPGVPEFTRSYDTRHATIRRAKSLISGGGAYLPFALD